MHLRVNRRVGQPALRGLGNAEVDDLRHGHAVVQRDEDVRRLEIAMDDPFLMRVLHRLADLDEKIQTLRRRVALKVIKLGMDTKEVLARFEAERQALAMMDHPNIAKVLDAGTTEGSNQSSVISDQSAGGGTRKAGREPLITDH